ncbi:MAG: sulfurtransferase [Solirubrobacterales bacterium]|nr:sulfurtransferase [Solirubrobacterales bacterium]
MLISPHRLLKLLADPDAPRPTLLDVRWQLGGRPGREEYEEGHIAGASFVDLDAELAGSPGFGGRHPLPTRKVFQLAMRRAGVSSRRAVIAYDGNTSAAAARCWWLLRYFGHPDVSVLDGGFAAWTAAGGAVEAGSGAVPPEGDFVAGPAAMPLLGAAGAAELAHAGVLLDARAPERFRGEHELVDPVAGHIPGARNLPAGELLDASGRFLEPARLQEKFERAGVRRGAAVGAYCGSGVNAAHTVLALELAGLAGALYAGSWSEWITDPRRPVALGRGRFQSPHPA